MKKMKAFVKVKPGPGGTEYGDFEAPDVGPEDILIEVKAAGLCGTDMHLYDWADNIVREYQPDLPRIMGHEFAGRIAEIGSHVAGFHVGDRVTAFPIMYCGTCSFCKNGQPNICDHRPIMGLGVNGAFAQFVAVRAANVYRLDDELPYEIGALSEIASVGLHAIERVRLRLGDTVAVVGCGPLGLTMAILAKHAGAARVFITGLEQDRQRLELAEAVNIIPISVVREDPGQKIAALAGAKGADVVFETAGSSEGVVQSLQIVRKGGRISILGQGHAATRIHTAELSFREITLVGTRAYTSDDWSRVSDTLLNTAEDMKQMITHRIPLENAEQGIGLMKARKGVKIILEP